MTFAIHTPVETIPERPLTRPPQEDWSLPIAAAIRANGLWTPIVFQQRSDARRLAEAAQKRTRRRFEAVVDGFTCYLRVQR